MPDKKYSPTLEILESFLEKARRRMSDEEPDLYEQSDEDYTPEEDLSDHDEDDADAWLKENDPSAKPPEEEKEEQPSTPAKPAPVEASKPVGPAIRRKVVPSAPVSAPSAPAVPGGNDDDEFQPTREELQEMREYTRPWEQQARDRSRLEAQAHVNPILHHRGRVLEARATTHADKQKALAEFENSPEFQNADPITQFDLLAKFHDDWNKSNPDHLKNFVNAHQEATKKGAAGQELFNQTKDEKIRHIAGGGVQPGAFSIEEGLQHAGGSREDDDSAPSGISQDKGAQFAVGNQEFLRQYMDRYNKKSGGAETPTMDRDSFENERRANIDDILGSHPALQDPKKRAKANAFVSRYYPLIQKAKWRVLNKLGLRDQARSGQIDEGILDFAGMHALYQAVNDYDHDHPSQAKFKTHLNRKLHGLMQTALKQQDEIPQELRTGAKKFDQQKRAVNAAPIKHTDKFGNVSVINPAANLPTPQTESAPAPAPLKPVGPTIIRRSSQEIAAKHPPEVQDRLKRVAAAKQPLVRPGTGMATPQKKWNVNIVHHDDENGEE